MGRARSAARRVLAVWCPDWSPDTPDAGPAARAFEQAVTAVEEFCPRVEVIRPGICALAAAGPARYFGGEAALARKITDTVTALGFACRAGVADGLFAAQLAARAAGGPGGPGAGGAAEAAGGVAGADSPVAARAVRAPAGSASHSSAGSAGRSPRRAGPAWVIVAAGGTPAFLAPYPVSVLDVPELTDLLPRLGIWTIGDFARLPAAEAANRFGLPGRRAHRLARGLDPRPLVPRQLSADLSVQADFDPPAEQAEPVVFAAKALAERLHAGLTARGLACVRVQVQATCADGQDISRLWRHDGLLSALAVAERVRWQLDSWRTSRDLGERKPAGGMPRGRDAGGEMPAGGMPGRGDAGGEVPGCEIPGGRGTDGRDTPGDDPGARDRSGGRGAAEATLTGGIIRLRLVPDQLVRDEGRQLALWGDAVISDRVARAATRAQAMLGHAAVMRPVLAGGRDPAEQVTLIPFGDSGNPLLPAARPWPGRIPAPAPATVYLVPVQARVTDDSGTAVTVTGRAVISAPPARFSADGGPWLTVIAWAGPWPVNERWWAAASARRRARFQLVTEDGNAWLAAVQDGGWVIEASYD
jgi:protein ImuB